jgi:hypothetical protein
VFEIELNQNASGLLTPGGTARLTRSIRILPRAPMPQNGETFRVITAAAIEETSGELPCGYEVTCHADDVDVRIVRASITGDLNRDGVVNVIDLLEVLSAWGACARCPADLDGSGSIDGTDLLIVLANWK